MNKNDIQVVVVDFRRVNDQLRRWVRHWPDHKYASDICKGTFRGLDLLAVWRNQIAEWFMDKTKHPWLFTMDNDAIPRASTLDLLNCEADISVARFFSRAGGEGHGQDGEGSMAAMKISRRALRKIPRPWFKFEFNENHTAMTTCECNWFTIQAKKVGIHPVKAGFVGHYIEAGFGLKEQEEGGMEMQFAHKIKDAPWTEEERDAQSQAPKPTPREGQKKPPAPPQKIAIPGRKK